MCIAQHVGATLDEPWHAGQVSDLDVGQLTKLPRHDPPPKTLMEIPQVISNYWMAMVHREANDGVGGAIAIWIVPSVVVGIWIIIVVPIVVVIVVVVDGVGVTTNVGPRAAAATAATPCPAASTAPSIIEHPIPFLWKILS